jgi:hypothetical protein
MPIDAQWFLRSNNPGILDLQRQHARSELQLLASLQLDSAQWNPIWTCSFDFFRFGKRVSG